MPAAASTAAGSLPAGPSSRTAIAILALVAFLSSYAVVYMLGMLNAPPSSPDPTARSSAADAGSTVPMLRQRSLPMPSSSSSPFGVGIPEGKAVALPSVRTTKQEEEQIQSKRKIYGGVGDKAHLGGFTELDLHGVSPAVWTKMISWIGIKTLLDVGCGKGVSTSWFVLHGVDATCVEGSHDAVSQSLIPDPTDRVVEHDFSRGPWWPSRTVDAVWCVEFTEHVGRNFQQNYLTAFRKAALVFVTHSNWGGWHHVEVHSDDWWRVRFEAAGFVYSEHLTKTMRSEATRERGDKNAVAPNGEPYNAQHLWTTLMVFINPTVASLPEHQHLFAEHGCYDRKGDERIYVECGTTKTNEILTPLPESFKPLKLDSSFDEKWAELIKKSLLKDKSAEKSS